MITHATLPKTYKPYQTLTVCSNLVNDGGHLIAVGDVIPLLIGSGETPMVWLLAPTDKLGTGYIQLVAASVATHPTVSVISDRNGLTISVGSVPVIHVVQTDETSAKIDLLDLRPIGFNIYGDSASLKAGALSLSGNRFSGGSTMLAFAKGQ